MCEAFGLDPRSASPQARIAGEHFQLWAFYDPTAPMAKIQAYRGRAICYSHRGSGISRRQKSNPAPATNFPNFSR
jgi:hypothetical protein